MRLIRADYADHISGIPDGETKDRRTNTTIRIYTESELEGIRKACRIGREVLDCGGRAVRAGVTCDEIDRVVSGALLFLLVCFVVCFLRDFLEIRISKVTLLGT